MSKKLDTLVDAMARDMGLTPKKFRALAKTKPEPSWLVHLHYGPKHLPLTVYDNHDGTFTYADDDTWVRNASPDMVLRAFAAKMNEVVLCNMKLHG